MSEHDFAAGLVQRAGGMLKRSLSKHIEVSYKEGPRDPVTNVDKELSAFLSAEIAAAYPGDAIYSEEGADAVLPAGGRTWIIDPIDGTGNFSHRIPHFSICVACVEQGAPAAGAIYNPVTDELFSFAGGSAFLHKETVHASTITEPRDAQGLLIVGHQPALWPWGEKIYPSLLKNLNKLKGLGSANLDLAFLAAGRADIVVYGTFSMPDGLPGVGMVRAAGGEVYDLSTGDPLAYTKGRKTIVAVAHPELFEKTRSLLHAELLPR